MASLSAEPRLQIAFLTGRSRPVSCALSPVQASFLERLAGRDRSLVPRNFPYFDPPGSHRPVPLILASWRNGMDFWSSRWPEFRLRYQKPVQDLLLGAPKTVFLAGSCGLELLSNLGLPPEVLRRVAVFAYGPVVRKPPSVRLFSVQGRDDVLSRWFRPAIDRVVDCHHLDYLESPEVLALASAFLDRIEEEH